jgi:hypothetical protein
MAQLALRTLLALGLMLGALSVAGLARPSPLLLAALAP